MRQLERLYPAAAFAQDCAREPGRVKTEWRVASERSSGLLRDNFFALRFDGLLMLSQRTKSAARA
jgi:hypothetical protein